MDESNKDASQSANSDSKPEVSNESQAEIQKETQTGPKERAQSRKKLLNSGTDLKKALDAWEEISQKPLAPSPNEQMLNDVKDLLKQLKDKIEEFK